MAGRGTTAAFAFTDLGREGRSPRPIGLFDVADGDYMQDWRAKPLGRMIRR